MNRHLRAILAAPPLHGAIYLFGLAVWAGQREQADDVDLGGGRRADAVATFIDKRFAGEVTKIKIGIVAAAIAIGLLVGIVADIVIRLRAAKRAPFAAVVEGFAVCAVVHACLTLWAMADSPQLYAARWYATGGPARTIQVVATDVLGTRGVVLLFFLLIVAYVKPRRLFVALRRGIHRARRAIAFVVPVGLLLLWGRRAPEAAAKSEKSEEKRMNVLLLAADSLRADRLDPRVAPHLVALAERSTRFDRAYVSIPRTFPSWVTILSGRHSHHHGVRSMFPTWEDRAKPFDALPRRLSDAGFETGVVSDYAGDIFGRIDLGFAKARVDTPSFDFRQLIRQRALERETPLLPVLHSRIGRALFPVMKELADGADPTLLADEVDRTLGGIGTKNPFFLTVFFSTAHFPYAAPSPWYGKFTDPGYRGRFKYHKPVGLGADAPPDLEDQKQIRALYDGSVAAIDAAVEKVLHTLERRGLADRTIIVVTADHGEMLYENGHGQGHGDHLFGDEVTHVPLLIYDPRDPKGRRVASITRDVDLAPTLYELTGVVPPSDLDGRSLGPALRGEALVPLPAFAETELWFTEDIPGVPADLRMPYPGIMALTELDAKHNAEIVLRREMTAPTLVARHRMVREERFKLIYVPTRKGVRYMLFDTVADPAEVKDVAGEHPEEVKRLRETLWSWMRQDPLMEEKGGYLVPRDPLRGR